MQIVEVEDVKIGWKPIGDLPKYGGLFLVWLEPPSGEHWQYDVALFGPLSRTWLNEDGTAYKHASKITHWSPLIDRPEL